MTDGGHDLPDGHLLVVGDGQQLQRFLQRGELCGRVGLVRRRQEGVGRAGGGLLEQELPAEAAVAAVEQAARKKDGITAGFFFLIAYGIPLLGKGFPHILPDTLFLHHLEPFFAVCVQIISQMLSGPSYPNKNPALNFAYSLLLQQGHTNSGKTSFAFRNVHSSFCGTTFDNIPNQLKLH